MTTVYMILITLIACLIPFFGCALRLLCLSVMYQYVHIIRNESLTQCIEILASVVASATSSDPMVEYVVHAGVLMSRRFSSALAHSPAICTNSVQLMGEEPVAPV